MSEIFDGVPDGMTGELVGRKFDADKLPASILPARALIMVAEVLAYGERKYGRDNWRHVSNAQTRYKDALMRHVLAWLAGESNDRESGKSHVAHATCCLLFLLEFLAEEESKAGRGPLDRMA